MQLKYQYPHLFLDQYHFVLREATIYVYNAGEKDYLRTFSQLTQKDGTFIVSRKDIKKGRN